MRKKVYNIMLGVLGFLIALIGWFGFKSLTSLIIGTVFYLIETLIEWKNLNLGAKIIDIIVFGIGCFISCKINIPFYIGGMLAVHIYSAVLTVFLGAIMLFSKTRT